MGKPTVLYDAKILENGLKNDATRTGIFFVSYNIVKHILLDNRVDLYIYCQKEAKELTIRYFQKEFNHNIKSRIVIEGEDLSNITTFLSTVFTTPEYIKRFPQITCFTIIHDVIPLIFPHYFGSAINSWFEELVKGINKDDFYFAVSKYTKQDFIKYIPAIDEQKITVIPLAADSRFYQNKDSIELHNIKTKYKIPLDKKYIFSLCTLEERKNLIRAVGAFISFIEKNKIEDLVYVLGGGTWEVFVGRLEKEVPNYHKYANRIIQAGYVADEDLAVLFSNAEWFVYTSQYEGFGMPPLEAMQCGCPVVVSNNSSLPEVVGNAGIMIDYNSLSQHIEAYESYYYNPELRKLNSQEGLSRARQFNWNKSTEIIVNKMIEIEQKKQRKPLISIITITYNLIEKHRESYIKQCIESVHQQTYPNIEHIIIDGASTDGTVKLLNEYVEKGWITLYSEPDQGIYDAMNKGIAKAHGTYINFLNSDDYFHNNQGIEFSMEYLMKCEADYSFADTLILQENGKKNFWKGDISKLLIGTHYCHQTMLVKTEVLKSINGFDTSYPVAADSDLMIRLYAKKYKHTYVPFCFLTYRLGGFSGENSTQIRIDHSTSFFNHIGTNINLTPYDCFLLWQQHFFNETLLDKQLNLISKVPAEFGAEYLTNQLIEKTSPYGRIDIPHNLKFYLFGAIPALILHRKNRRNKTYYYLFNTIRVMKIVRHDNKRKFYLFGILPILKIKINSKPTQI